MAYSLSSKPTAKQACSWLWENYKENLEKNNFSHESSMEKIEI